MINSISNLAWKSADTFTVLPLLKKHKIDYLEIAPSKIDSEQAFSKTGRKKILEYKKMAEDEGLKIASMQSILYGLKENLFGSSKEIKVLLGRFKDAIELADYIDCRHIVFGSPRNRMGFEVHMLPRVVNFFAEVESFAFTHNVVIGIEGNSKKYGNTFLTNAEQVVHFTKQFNSNFLKCNFDFGNEVMEQCKNFDISHLISEVSQIQISMPYLEVINLDFELKNFLNFCLEKEFKQRKSVEMLCDDVDILETTLRILNNS